MSAKSSKGLKICVTKGTATGSVLVPTAISKAKPAVVTVADVSAMAAGDIVNVEDSGFTELDGKSWVVGTLDTGANTFELVGSDTTASAGSLGASPKATHFAVADMECLCLSTITINVDEPGTVSVGTYCDPTASIPSAVQAAGTLSFAGFVNVADKDYAELLLAADDGKQRYLRIMLPGNGFLVAPVVFSSITWDLPLDGAVGYSGSAVLGSKVRHLF